MTWAKVFSLVCRFRCIPWTNGPNTQLKWKLRYSPIKCTYLEPSVTHFSNRRCNGIGLKRRNWHRTFGVCIDFSAYALMFGNIFAWVSQTCSYTSLNIEKAQQKYRNRVSECSFSPLSVNVSAIIVQWQRPDRSGLSLMILIQVKVAFIITHGDMNWIW